MSNGFIVLSRKMLNWEWKDALNGIAWKDGSQVVTEHVYKFYSDRPRLVIEVYKWKAGK